jgi:PST family polysaccharide transporter
MLNYFIRNADNMILGYFGGPAALGLYTKSYGLLTLPLSQFLSPISAVTVPTLCRLAGEPLKFRDFFLRSAGVVVVMVILATTAAFAVAPELVAIVLGPGWEPASNIFRILAPGAIVSSTNIAGAWVCTPLGLTNRQFKSALFVAPTYIVGFLIGSQWGAEGVAAAFSITCALLRVPVFRFMLRGTPVNPGDLWVLMLRPFLVGVSACSLAMATGFLWDEHVFGSLAIKTTTFVAVIGVAHRCKILVLPIRGLRSALRTFPKTVA